MFKQIEASKLIWFYVVEMHAQRYLSCMCINS